MAILFCYCYYAGILFSLSIEPVPTATVQFDPITYSATEGESVTFILVLSEPVSEAVTVDIVTIENTAFG